MFGAAALRKLITRHEPAAKPTANPLVSLLLGLASEEEAVPYLGFGIGCFHFGARPETFSGSAAEHVREIGMWLESVPSISNVDIEDPEQGWFETNLDYGLRNGGQPFPAIRGLRIDLDLRADSQALGEYSD